MAKELTVKDVVEFKAEDWTTAAYPINVRLTNMRNRWIEHTKVGLPAPMSAVVCLTDLVERTNTTLDENAITSILQTLEDQRTENEVRRMQLETGEMPTRAGYPDQHIYEQTLMRWRQKVWYLANLYAACVYREQIAALKGSGKTFENIDYLTSRASRTATWDYVAWYNRTQPETAVVDFHDRRNGGIHEVEETDGLEFDPDQRAVIDRFATRVNRTPRQEEEQDQEAARAAQIEAQGYEQRVAEEQAKSRESTQEGSINEAPQGIQEDDQLPVRDDSTSEVQERSLEDEINDLINGADAQNDEQVNEAASQTAEQRDTINTATGASSGRTQNASQSASQTVGNNAALVTSEIDQAGRLHYRAGTTGRFTAGSSGKSKSKAGKGKKTSAMAPPQNTESTTSEQPRRKRKRAEEAAGAETQESGVESEAPVAKRLRRRNAGEQNDVGSVGSQEDATRDVDEQETSLSPSEPSALQQAQTPYLSDTQDDALPSNTINTGDTGTASGTSGAAAAEVGDADYSTLAPARPKIILKLKPRRSARESTE